MKITLCKQQFELLTLIFVTITILLLISFGNWQLARLGEKENFITSIETNIAAPAIMLSDFKTTPPNYSKISISGDFLPHKDVYLYGRRTAYPEKDGYYLLSAFVADNSQIYMVSRGWFPHSAKDKLDTSAYQPIENIEGIVLPSEKKNFFVPDNDQKNNIWFTLDLQMATEVLGTTNANFYIMQINSDSLPEGVAPLTTKHLSKVRNDHLEYAITWYSLAGCLFIMFMVSSCKKKT
jgi:surfeit locus 1 family protein